MIVGDKVQILNSIRYGNEYVDEYGVVERLSFDEYPNNLKAVGVRFDGYINEYSGYGIFWFGVDDIRKIKEGEEIMVEELDINNCDFDKIAIVKIMNSCIVECKMYSEDKGEVGDWCVIISKNGLKTNVGEIKEIFTPEEYISSGKKKCPTNQVATILNLENYYKRVEEEEKKEELEKKKKALEKEIADKIKQHTDLDYYRKMAKILKSTNPELTDMVKELEGYVK